MIAPINVTIIEIINETTDTKTFVLKFPIHIANISYEPGQYLTLCWKNNNKTIDKRNYSITKWVPDNNIVHITIKRIENGAYSRLLFDKAQVGDILTVDNIAGFFTLPTDISHIKQVCFIVAGSGITPVIPIITHLIQHHPSIRINLLYANKTPASTIFFNTINLYQTNYAKQLQVTYLFSQIHPIQKARLNNTLLTQFLEEQIIEPKAYTLFFTCGPIDFMDMVSITLLTEGVPKNNIKKEVFFTELPEILEQPEDTSEHQVTLSFTNGKIATIQVQYPHSILDAALEKGIQLPYSCRSGQCGSCTAKIKKGKVFMSYNEVLTDADIAKHLTLTCTGFPIEGDVSLEF